MTRASEGCAGTSAGWPGSGQAPAQATVRPTPVRYLPYEARRPDTQYRELLARILDEGEDVPTAHGVPARRIIGHLLRFPLEHGFPVITERDLVSAPPGNGRPSPFSQALGELCAFLNGAHTQEALERFGCFWWDRWVSAERCARLGLPPGDLGPASYGAAFRRFPTAEGEPFDQLSHLVAQIRAQPELRYHEVTPWIPQYLLRPDRRAAVPPCHGWFHVHLHPLTRELVLSHRQRSADAPVGLVFNLIQYAALALMLAQVTGYRAREVVYYLDDVHIYATQRAFVERLLATPPGRFPTVEVDPTVEDLFAFRPHHFTVRDYVPALPRMRIPTPL